MSAFYNPVNRKPAPWVTISFILIPILLVIIAIIISKNIAQSNAKNIGVQEKDVFR